MHIATSKSFWREPWDNPPLPSFFCSVSNHYFQTPRLRTTSCFAFERKEKRERDRTLPTRPRMVAVDEISGLWTEAHNPEGIGRKNPRLVRGLLLGAP